MEFIIKFAEGFMGLFQTGADVFSGWVTGIIPQVLLLLIAMNTLIRLIGEDKINRFAKFSAKSPILRYMVVPFLGAFMLGNPMALSLGRFMPERMKPSYYASASYFCHTSSGVFPHINPGEVFIYLGVASGIETLGYSTMPLAVRYLLVGLVCNFISGWATDFTTKMVMKQQGINLSNELKSAQ
ncbi:PTS glucitol/sorbitol transporter subunit IIC [Paraclostridium bifermentans]|uniref:PTS glucitol/sorbitol transporter subunit IIC n=1 Tax=Paraclostridium bifermentans TaxID=1490 RepID=UPI00359C727D